MYRWWVFIHLVGVVGFLLSHGASVAATFLLRRLRDPVRIAGLLQLSGASMSFFYPSILLLLTGGIAAGVVGGWWNQYWIWVSLGTFVAIAALMFPLGRGYFERIRQVLRIVEAGGEAVGPDELARVMNSGRPMLLVGIGVGGVLFIVYLMVIKPW